MRPLTILLSCLLVGGFVWLATSGEPESDMPTNGAETLSFPGRRESEFPATFVAQREVPVDSREQALQGRVVSSEGVAIPGVEVAWIALEAEDAELNPPWPLGGWGIPDRAKVVVRTDMSGVFMFAAMPATELTYGSVLTAARNGYFPSGQDLPPAKEEWPSFIEIALEPTQPVSVEVVASNGQPQAGATVHHVTQVRESNALALVPEFEHHLSETAITDAAGQAEMAAFRGTQAFWAQKGELLSIPWTGSSPSRVVLRLEDAFRVSGSLMVPNWQEWDPNYRGERRIVVSGREGSLWRPLARLRDVEQGEWGPMGVALGSYRRFSLRLEGAPIVAIEKEFDRPKAGASLRFDLVAEKLAELRLFVQDEHGEPITTARAEIRWPGPFGVNRADGAARPDGYLYIGTVPPGSVWLRVLAPGYAPYSVETAVPFSDVLLIVLQEGGRVHGRCMHEGEPVRDFEVIYTNEGTIRDCYSRQFMDREDGRFEIDALGIGDWSIYAASPLYPSSKPVPVSVKAGTNSEILLELPAGIRGAGRVVDSGGNSVSDARVQAYSSGGMERSFPWGPPALTQADGVFELDAFVLGSNYITVEADGFARAQASAIATDRQFLEWGDITLHRPQALRFSLLGLENRTGITPEEVRTYPLGGLFPEARFESDGSVRIDGVPPGDVQLIVSPPDDTWARIHLRLEPGKEWSFDHKMAGDRRLDIRLLDARGEPVSYDTNLIVAAQEDTGNLVLRGSFIHAGALASFEGIRAGQAQILVNDADFNALVTKDVTFGEALSLQVDVRIGGSPVRIRVVDVEGAVLAGAWVSARSNSGSEIYAVDDTGADGWAELFGLPEREVLLDVRHGIAGFRQGVPVDASVKEHEVVLNASGSLELVVLDGDEPLRSVVTRIETTGGVSLSIPKETDQAGHVRYEALGEGHYLIACRRTDCWPAVVDYQLASDEHAVKTVQMRQLASLALTVFNEEGLPVSGLDVELSSSEFGVDVAEWLAGERVRSSTGLRTNRLGQIHVDGLPRGFYVCNVPTVGGPTTGAFDLQPRKPNEVSIRLVQ